MKDYSESEGESGLVDFSSYFLTKSSTPDSFGIDVSLANWDNLNLTN